MASRHQDWLNQGRRDVQLARWCIEGGHYEWACFAAQQAAEKVIKAVFQKLLVLRATDLPFSERAGIPGDLLI